MRVVVAFSQNLGEMAERSSHGIEAPDNRNQEITPIASTRLDDNGAVIVRHVYLEVATVPASNRDCCRV